MHTSTLRSVLVGGAEMARSLRARENGKSRRQAFQFVPLVFPSLLLMALPVMAQTTERVSVDSSGAQGNSLSTGSTMSADGRYVAFNSDASNLVAGDTNETTDLFVHDRSTGATERVSVDSSGAQGNSLSGAPAISNDGRYVAFFSLASNLVAGDTNGQYDIFVHDRSIGTTQRVSVDSSGAQGNSISSFPTISADGRYVAFYSRADNLVAGDTNGWDDVFVHDRSTGVTQRVSVDSSGAQGNLESRDSAISADGRYVAFHSRASNLVIGDTNAAQDVFVHDRSTGATERVSVDSSGAQGSAFSFEPAISADGRYVAFDSLASNLVIGDTNATQDVFVHDRSTGATQRVSVDSGGAQGNSDSRVSTISADGRYVAFHSFASNLVIGDTNGAQDIFVHDRSTGATERVSIDSSGVQGNFGSQGPAISADGRYVAFSSLATNLVAGDTNGRYDVFVHDREPSVLYSFGGGFNQPVDNLPVTNSAKAGGTIPLKWQLTDADGNFVSDLSVVESLQYAPVACDSQDLELVDPIEAYAPGASGLHYDPLTNQFIFPWKTLKSQKNTCVVFVVTLTDGQQQFARFLLK